MHTRDHAATRPADGWLARGNVVLVVSHRSKIAHSYIDFDIQFQQQLDARFVQEAAPHRPLAAVEYFLWIDRITGQG